jgi:hypothetical protein
MVGAKILRKGAQDDTLCCRPERSEESKKVVMVSAKILRKKRSG